MYYVSIRGATTVNNNTKEEILSETKALLQEMIKRNGLDTEDIISVIFTATKDLDKVYPAIAARELGITNAGLMCMQEMYVEGSLQKCIRVLLTCTRARRKSSHVYLKEAVSLRPDLADKLAIAIDGPAGSGKSTVAKLIAKEKGYIYVDTGAMYRTVALHCIRKNKNTENPSEVMEELDHIKIDLSFKNNEQRIYLNNEDVTDLIRSQEVAKGSSDVAAIHAVRQRLVSIQQELARENDVVMDGRDIGTHVLPNAQVKIYLEADKEERANRRCKELKDRNLTFVYEEVKKEIETRDFNDMNREFSPLRKAADAVLLDTTNKSIGAVKNEILAIVNKQESEAK